MLPDVPTIDEAGVKGYDMGYWFAAYVPAGTPAPVVARLHELLVAGTKSAAAKAVLRQHRLRSVDDDARRAGEVPGRRVAEVGHGDQGGRHRAGVTGLASRALPVADYISKRPILTAVPPGLRLRVPGITSTASS